MGLRGIDESVFPKIAQGAQEPTAIYTDGSKTAGLGYFWMTRIYTVLDCLDTVVFSLLNWPPFILPAI
jgi:hypothetical protein